MVGNKHTGTVHMSIFNNDILQLEVYRKMLFFHQKSAEKCKNLLCKILRACKEVNEAS